jgi:hypothetical protein
MISAGGWYRFANTHPHSGNCVNCGNCRTNEFPHIPQFLLIERGLRKDADRTKGRGLVNPQPSRMTQPRFERSEPPAPQARASGPLHASRGWASGRFRALRDRTLACREKQFDYQSQPYIAALECANPPPGAPQSERRGRSHTSPPKFPFSKFT